MTKLESLQEDFGKAIRRLEESLREPKTDIVRDSAIKRFELSFDLAWKTAKAFLEKRHNVSCASPRNCFREGFRVGMLDYDEFWLAICDLRNEAVHTYSEELAEKVYAELPRALSSFQRLDQSLKKPA